jgi:hypothetical protein
LISTIIIFIFIIVLCLQVLNDVVLALFGGVPELHDELLRHIHVPLSDIRLQIQILDKSVHHIAVDHRTSQINPHSLQKAFEILFILYSESPLSALIDAVKADLKGVLIILSYYYISGKHTAADQRPFAVLAVLGEDAALRQLRSVALRKHQQPSGRHQQTKKKTVF